MKAMILAGGFGTRLSEETELRPKPMVKIGGRPILWHIMDLYARNGISEFIICAGYKGEHIKKFFLDYAASLSDFTVDLSNGEVCIHRHRSEQWKVTVVDTGMATMTGGRIKRAMKHIGSDEIFCLTYGDGLSDVDIKASVEFHKSHKKLATVTAVTPPGRFGILEVDTNKCVTGFHEKVASDQYQINGGFFVLNSKVADLIDNDQTVWEQEPMKRLAASGQLVAWKHTGFWQAMDTLREKQFLEELWNSGAPPWRSK